MRYASVKPVCGMALCISLVVAACGGSSEPSTSVTSTTTKILTTNGVVSGSIVVPDEAGTVASGAPVAFTTNSSTNDSVFLGGLSSTAAYAVVAKAVDAASNALNTNTIFEFISQPALLEPRTRLDVLPIAPTGLTTSIATSTSLTISWTGSVGAVSYNVYLNGALVDSTSATSFTLTGLSASTSYVMTVKAVDAAGNMSAASVILNASTPPIATNTGDFAITAATLGANIVTVTGVGFGTKAQAAPIKFEDFDNRTTGAAPATFGYTNYGGFGGSTTVDISQAYSGGKSLRHQGNFGAVSGSDVAESFPHIAVTGFSASELYLSYRLKFRTHGGRITQLKFNRSGMEIADAYGSPCYGGKPKYYSSYYPDGPGVNRYSADKRLISVQGGTVGGDNTVDEGWIGEDARMGSGTVLALEEDTWVQVEEYYRLNDIGQINGEHVTWVNGNLQIDRHSLKARSKASEMLNCSYLVVGMDYWINPSSTDGVSVWYDDHYLDSSRARLVLANAATWSSSTIRSPQPATQWNTTTVTAQLKTGGFAASADAWLYVVRADGNISAGWKIHLN